MGIIGIMRILYLIEIVVEHLQTCVLDNIPLVKTAEFAEFEKR